MERSWPAKNGSAFPPSSQELPDQTRMILGHHFHQHFAQGLRSNVNGRTQDPLFPPVDDVGNSFLGLLSWPQSQFQCDYYAHEGSQPKAFAVSGKPCVDGIVNVNFAADGAGFGTMSAQVLTGTLSNINIDRGANSSLAVSARIMSAAGTGISAPSDSFGDSNLSFRSSILPKAVCRNMVPDPLSTHVSDCPRVFCLNTSGHLLLSNTGLIGIVCSCHSRRMSVPEFCEHSGSFGLNAGDAVRMHSGETISQWRKSYFQKFGIRVSEDQSGWDWPQGLSAGSVRSSASASSQSNICALATRVSSVGCLIKSSLPVEDMLSPKVPQTNENSVGALDDRQQRSEDSTHILPKGLIYNSFSSLHAAADNQLIECLTSKCSAASTLGNRQSNTVCHSASPHVACLVNTGNSSASQPTSQSLSIPGKCCDVSSSIRARNVASVERDPAFSNIELKLGQPYEQNRPSGNSSLSVTKPKLLDILVDPSKSRYLEQTIQNVSHGGEKREPKEHFHCATGMSDFFKRRDARQVNFGNHAFKTSDVNDVSQLEKLGGHLNKNFGIPQVKQFNVPPNDCEGFRGTNNAVNICEFVPVSAYCESHAANSHPFNIPRDGGSGLERMSYEPDHDSLRPRNKDKRMTCNLDGPNSISDSAIKVKWRVENSCSFAGVTCGSMVPGFMAADHKNSYPHALSNGPQNAFVTKDTTNNHGMVPTLGISGCTSVDSFRPTGLPVGSGKVLQPPAFSMSFPPATSVYLPGFPARLRQEKANCSPCLLDDKMRLLSLWQISDLSKQHHATASVGMNQKLESFGAPSSLKEPHSLNGRSTVKEQMEGPDLIINQTSDNVAVPSVQSGTTCAGGTPSPKNNCMPALLSYRPLLREQPKSRKENISQSINNDKGCQRILCACLQRNCCCIGHRECRGGNSKSKVGSSSDFLKQQLDFVNCDASMSFSSKVSEDHVVPSEGTFSLHQRENLDGKSLRGIIYDASLWRDVPSKNKMVSDVDRVECSTDMLNASSRDEVQPGQAATGCLGGSLQVSISPEEQEISNVSSASPVHAIGDTGHVGKTGHVDNPIVDEGSGIDKCGSSDEAFVSEKSIELLSIGCKTSFRKEGSSSDPQKQSYCSLLDELKLIDSLTWKKGRTQASSMLPVRQKTDRSKSLGGQFKARKRKNDAVPMLHDGCLKCSKRFDGPSYTFKNNVILLPGRRKTFVEITSSIRPALKCQRSTFPWTKERNLQSPSDESDWEDDYQSESDGPHKNLEVSCKRKMKRTRSSNSCQNSLVQEKARKCPEKKTAISNSVKLSCSRQAKPCCMNARPIVCGNYGEISCGRVAGDVLKPTKFRSLRRILKTARRCTLTKDGKLKLTSPEESKKRSLTERDSHCYRLSKLQKKEENVNVEAFISHEMNINDSVENGEDWSKNGCNIQHTMPNAKLGPKETLLCSLYELTEKGKDSICEGKNLLKASKCITKMNEGQFSKKNSCTIGCHEAISSEVEAEVSAHLTKGMAGCDPEAFCCSVCGSSDSDEVNCLLECNQCRIRVHQACYGVPRVPKGDWYCRPCRTNSKDIVCVLCGYGGGAMTRALQSQAIVKSLLKAWNVLIERMPMNLNSSGEIWRDDGRSLDPLGSAVKGGSYLALGPGSSEPSTAAAGKVDLQNDLDAFECSEGDLRMRNSIIAGFLNSSVKQWLHMVCGLWTPGTRCPNVHTMSAFDVSGVSYPRQNIVCSVCNRPGGSCIQCRVMNCSVQFHPWCAHQKGLLQSEVEGDDNENIGFYGRCLHHAANPTCESSFHIMDTKTGGLEEEKESTCARTEGYKGRKHDGFWHNPNCRRREKGGCFVTHDQVNAWSHINRKLSRMRGLSTVPVTSIEYDCRKEYARYKQAKGWRHLVVYKSGIHALGLYTSRFISRSEMVVEYVGEIVGPRVADRRENEYESGKKLQYKSACYFFRIDKEHIIDATRRGGIARFVNHSCMPNCVAKVISIRNEKKVVFFAERDIYPGEEITYDYHFNHEDEGKKIPCFCNSKNCRHYLN